MNGMEVFCDFQKLCLEGKYKVIEKFDQGDVDVYSLVESQIGCHFMIRGALEVLFFSGQITEPFYEMSCFFEEKRYRDERLVVTEKYGKLLAAKAKENAEKFL